MNADFIRPIPKYLITAIQKADKIESPAQKGLRMYSYLTTIRKELVKITVAVKNHKKKWYFKQVAAHGIQSDKCWVRDMEYIYFGYGYRVGWHSEGLTKTASWYEDGKWYDADIKYYNPYSTTVNPEYVGKFPEYRYSAYQHLDGRCIIEYLKLYKKYPQTEYLLKLGLVKLTDSLTVLKKVSQDKKFCKWLIINKSEIAANQVYVGAMMQAYKTGRPIKQVQLFEQCKKNLNKDNNLQPLKEQFGNELQRLFSYLESQDSNPYSYLDYLKACNFLGLDMNRQKNRYPHNFKRWHDIRVDEFNTAKALADETARAELYKQFAAVSQKYMPLQKCKKDDYAALIAKSPAELTREGECLNHCVGRMNYDQKMVREETLIFFVRSSDKPDVPFVTVEYSLKLKKVLQCYGYGDKKPDDTVLHYVNKVWLPYANRAVKRIAA